MKVLIVGLNPSRLGGNAPSLKTLEKWINKLELTTYSHFNLFNDYEMTQSNIDEIIKMSKSYDKIICLGSLASKALYLHDVDHYRLPHPSPRNRMMNRPQFIEQELNGCKSYLYSR